MNKTLNANLTIPLQLQGQFSYEEMEDTPDIEDDNFDVDTEPEYDGVINSIGNVEVLYPPDPVTVVEQNLHYNPDDGSLVVDVILEVDDQDNIVKYDVRMTKVEGGAGAQIQVMQ